MGRQAVIFCSQGLGDGVLFCSLAHNFQKNGWKVTFYHPFLQQLEKWFPSFTIRPFPVDEEIEKILSEADIILINEDNHPIKQKIQTLSREKFLKKSFFFKATTCKRVDHKNTLIDPQKSMVENLVDFCEKRQQLQEVFFDSGLKPISGLTFQKHPQRICIHPMSNDPQRNWPKEKFFDLAKKLKEKNFQPIFLTASFERDFWLWVEKDFSLPKISSLEEMASYIYESGFFIGNDSGVGHLASALKIPTMTIFTTKRKEKLWKPSFCEGISICPLPFLPNFKHCRLRDKYWEKGISVKRVFRNFMRFLAKRKNRDD